MYNDAYIILKDRSVVWWSALGIEYLTFAQLLHVEEVLTLCLNMVKLLIR